MEDGVGGNKDKDTKQYCTGYKEELGGMGLELADLVLKGVFLGGVFPEEGEEWVGVCRGGVVVCRGGVVVCRGGVNTTG